MRQLLYILILLAALQALARAQPVRQPFFLQQLDIQLQPRQTFPLQVFRTQYLNRVFDRKLRREIRDKALLQLRDQGYYFARLDSSSTHIDSTRRVVAHSLFISPGQQLHLRSITLQGDSLSASLRQILEELTLPYRGRIYTAELAGALCGELLAKMENLAYPLAVLTSRDFQLQEEPERLVLDLEIGVAPGDSVRLAYLKFPDRREDISSYLQRLLDFTPGQAYAEQRVRNYARVLRRQEFIKSVQAPVLAQDKSGRYFLRIDFVEGPATTLDGVVGYIPPPSGDPAASGYFTGLVNIGIRNLFGGGRKFHLFWEKEDKFSDAFRVNYREPYVFDLPLHTTVGMERLVRDTTYIEWQYHLNLEVPFNESLSAFVDFSNRSVTPDSLASRRLRLPLTASLVTGSGIRWDVRNDLQNPTRGVNMELAFSLSNQQNTGPAYLLAEDSLRKSVTLRRVRLDLATYLPTLPRQVLSNRLQVQFTETSGAELQLTDQFWFGGATTIRGFRESQFSARRVVWLNSEYRFLLGPEARFFVFSDNGWFKRDSPDRLERWLNSYGLGLRFGAPLGIVQVDFGLEKGAPFREGKLHFRLINEF